MKFSELRKSKGFRTQKELATAVGIKFATIGKWESGASSPKPKDYKKLAEVLRCSVEDILNCFI